MLILPLASALLATRALASPVARTDVVVESRASTPVAWKRSQLPLDPHSTFKLSIGLAQQNLHHLEGASFPAGPRRRSGADLDPFVRCESAELMKVSDPRSHYYGQHWSEKKVVDFFAPREETSFEVENWLVRSGIRISRHSISANKAWIKMNVTVLEAERLLNTRYSAFEHENGHMTIGGLASTSNSSRTTELFSFRSL